MFQLNSDFPPFSPSFKKFLPNPYPTFKNFVPYPYPLPEIFTPPLPSLQKLTLPLYERGEVAHVCYSRYFALKDKIFPQFKLDKEKELAWNLLKS